MNIQPLKIVSIIPYKVLPAILGGEKGIVRFTEYLSEQVVVTAVSTKNNDPALAKGYQLLNILSNNRSRYLNIFLYWRLKGIIKKEKPDYLLIEHPYYGWLAWLLGRTLKIKWVVHSHNIEYMRSRSIGRWWWKALQWYEGWVYRKADKVFFISEDDQAHALSTWNIPKENTLEVTYGIEQSEIPADIEVCRAKIMSRHGIVPGTNLLLFNGALYHATNYEALNVILDKINPRLQQEKDFAYKILICGKGLPESFNELRGYASQNIVYAGFVEDISAYFKAADLFINPILSGGGVKTKAIEALAMNCTVVSTTLGAMGIKKQVCGEKLIAIKDEDWKLFAETVITEAPKQKNTPNNFFAYYYWGQIINKVMRNLFS